MKHRRGGTVRRMVAKSAVGGALAGTVLVLTPGLAFAGDSPAGFWFGADGGGPGPSGTQMPSPCSGYYGYYAGRVETADDGLMRISYANQAQTNANGGHGVGVFAYGDLDGPMTDPSFNGSTTEATDYGEVEANGFANNYDTDIRSYGLDSPTYPLVFADMESQDTGWLTSANSGQYPNWQTLNRDVFDGFWSQIQTWTLPNTVTLAAAFYTNLNFFQNYMPNETIESTWLWEASWYYTGSSPSSCSLNGFSISGFSPQTIFGQSPSTSACFAAWQWASTSGESQDWDQVDQNRLNSSSCPE